MNNPVPASKDFDPTAGDEFVTIARVAKSQGRKGEVAAVLLTDFPERFESRRHVFILNREGQRREVELEQYWFHKGQIVLKFAGVDSISDAESLAGYEVQIPKSERAVLEEGTSYISDLIGCAVYNAGLEIGRIQEVQFGAGEAPLLVVKGEKEYLIPFAVEYIGEISLAEKRLDLKLPTGMLELDAPLTAEEKQRQKQSG